MPDFSNKWPQNVPGAFYVDRSCIICDACVAAAPDNFQICEEEEHAFVSKQPENNQELEEMREALVGCPVEAIGEEK